MKNIILLCLFALALVAGTTSAAVDPVRATGYVTALSGTSDYVVELDDKAGAGYYTPRTTTEICGQTYQAGSRYPVVTLTSSNQENVQAIVTWQPKPGESASAIGNLTRRQISRSPNTNIQLCDEVTLQWSDSGATVNLFRDNESVGGFSFNLD